MNTREKKLAAGLAAVLGVLAIYYVYDILAGKFNDREKQIQKWNQTIEDNQTKLAAGDRAQRKMKQWERRSLPNDVKLAPSLYESWLLKLVDDSQLESATVQQQTTVGHTGTFEKYAFQIKADADISMKQVVDFLYRFYSSNQLHKIRQLMIKPHVDGKALDVTIDIEALLLPGADRHDKLSNEKLDQLALGDVKNYEKIVDDRNLFSAYVPPHAQAPRVEARRPPAVDAAKYATVTGIIEQDDQPQVWVLVKTTGELLKLHEGEEFVVGNVKCKVLKIGVRDAVITTEGKLVQVSIGDNLREGTPVPAEDSTPSENTVQ
jgi:hypothetical protein